MDTKLYFMITLNINYVVWKSASIKIKNVTIRTGFSHQCFCRILEMVLINLIGPDSPFENDP